MNARGRNYYRVTFFGHSYVRDLMKTTPIRMQINNADLELTFITVPGGTFRTFLENVVYFDRLKEIDPHFTIVILGGNDLRANKPIQTNYQDCYRFYTTLKNYVPNTCIIGTEIENRFYKPNNRFGWPNDETFNRMRQQFNRFLWRQSFKDFVLRVQGPNLLDHESNYRDGVHLNYRGMRRFNELIKDSLTYAMHRFQRNSQPPRPYRPPITWIKLK